jgi:hypothetical protein
LCGGGCLSFGGSTKRFIRSEWVGCAGWLAQRLLESLRLMEDACADGGVWYGFSIRFVFLCLRPAGSLAEILLRQPGDPNSLLSVGRVDTYPAPVEASAVSRIDLVFGPRPAALS